MHTLSQFFQGLLKQFLNWMTAFDMNYDDILQNIHYEDFSITVQSLYNSPCYVFGKGEPFFLVRMPLTLASA